MGAGGGGGMGGRLWQVLTIHTTNICDRAAAEMPGIDGINWMNAADVQHG